MPKRTDIKKIMIIGSGPIVIGQACEFDYSGSQAAKALKEEGYEVVLVNSNPATIMTDPGLADRTYIEPIEPGTVARIIAREKPDAMLPTLGGQTGLNTAVALAESGVLAEHGVELIGASLAVIKKAESRELFREAMENIGLKIPQSGICHTMDDVREWGKRIAFPIIVRPAFTLGGTGGGVAYNMEDLEKISAMGLAASMKSEIMLERSVLGWKEFELEVMRDRADNCVIICSIENIDPMGVHTGDSVTVAPAQTLTDDEYQKMRDAAIAIMREIGVETGGSNVQFAVNPADGEMVIIEMNPRVSRSSALASKATGFPIAKIAAKLAVGYTLDEIPNDITRETMASFEPTIDYCVVKIPRFTFEKFPGSEDYLTTAMKSVGEAMSIGRNFKEALQKGLRSLEIGATGLGSDFDACEQDREAGAGRSAKAQLQAAVPGASGHALRRLPGRHFRGHLDRSLVPAPDPGNRGHGRRPCRLPQGTGRGGGPRVPGAFARSQEKRFFRSPDRGPVASALVAGRPQAAPVPGHRPHLLSGRHLRRRIRGLHARIIIRPTRPAGNWPPSPPARS